VTAEDLQEARMQLAAAEDCVAMQKQRIADLKMDGYGTTSEESHLLALRDAGRQIRQRLEHAEAQALAAGSYQVGG